MHQQKAGFSTFFDENAEFFSGFFDRNYAIFRIFFDENAEFFGGFFVRNYAIFRSIFCSPGRHFSVPRHRFSTRGEHRGEQARNYNAREATSITAHPKTPHFIVAPFESISNIMIQTGEQGNKARRASEIENPDRPPETVRGGRRSARVDFHPEKP